MLILYRNVRNARFAFKTRASIKDKYFEAPSCLQFEPEELVKIEDDEERVSKLQEGYGGWHPGMKKVKHFSRLF